MGAKHEEKVTAEYPAASSPTISQQLALSNRAKLTDFNMNCSDSWKVMHKQ
jgi:hypothetical protein